MVDSPSYIKVMTIVSNARTDTCRYLSSQGCSLNEENGRARTRSHCSVVTVAASPTVGCAALELSGVLPKGENSHVESRPDRCE